jgi:hypothetical protein
MSKKLVIPTKSEVKLFGLSEEDRKIIEPTREDMEIFGVDIIADDGTRSNGGLYAVSKPELCGTIPVRQDIVVLPADPVKSLSRGWTITEVVGTVAYNVRGLKGLRIGDLAWQDRIEDMLSEDGEVEND